MKEEIKNAAGLTVAEMDGEPDERARINRVVIDLMTKYELFGLTSQLLLAINAFTELVIAEKLKAYEEGKTMTEYDADMNTVSEATDAVHERWAEAVRTFAHDMRVAEQIIKSVIG